MMTATQINIKKHECEMLARKMLCDIETEYSSGDELVRLLSRLIESNYDALKLLKDIRYSNCRTSEFYLEIDGLINQTNTP